MNDETMNLIEERISERKHARRSFLKTAGLAAAGVAVATVLSQDSANAQRGGLDPAVLNFALNLEYLEAEYYLRAVGDSLAARGIGINGVASGANPAAGGAVTYPDTTRVTFATPLIEQYALEIADDEANHVAFLRTALGGAAVARPVIDLRNSFLGLGAAIGVAGFDPFANENFFLLGAFVFEDVGVTAYSGAAALLSNRSILTAAAGILAVEAYHAGEIRAVLAAGGFFAEVQAISDVRDSLDGGDDRDQGIGSAPPPVQNTFPASQTVNIIPTDDNSLAFTRTTTQVLNIVYGNPGPSPVSFTSPTTFFPNGLNGAIRS
ncbi:MAG: ferritin-like domain-containing protein [Fibrella sp.]|nr:ferritin-like domain-containing protein [Armatimonadota bacterium]